MKPGRNDPCLCGSGKKYKQCCMGKPEFNPTASKYSGKGVAPTTAECNQLVGLLNAGHYAELEKRARLLLERCPDSGFAWKMLGATLNAQAKDSLYAMQKAAELLPDDAEIHNSLGLAFKKPGRLNEAEACYRRAIQINPNNGTAHYNLGNALFDLRRLNEAEASYRRALQIEPNFTDAHYWLGNTLAKLGRLDEAEASYRRALQVKPDFAEAYSSLSALLQRLNRLDEAEASYMRAQQIKADDPVTHYNLGLGHQELGQLDEAEADYRRALQIKPDFTNAHSQLGIILRERGLNREAAHHFQQAFAQRVGWHHEGDKDLSSGLVHALIELTNKCNFHCDFCPSDSQQRTKGFMSMGLIHQLYDEFAEKKLVQQVSLHLMGEPTLHPQLVDVLAYASSKNIKTELVTNGSTLNAKTIPKILDALYGLFVISLQTPTRETFIHRGNAGLGWDRYIENIRLLVREYLKRIALGCPCQSTLALRVMVTSGSKMPANIIESWDDVRGVMHEWRNFVADIETEFGLTPFNRKDISSRTFANMSAQADMNYPLQQGLSLSFWQGFTFANSMLSSAYTLEYNKLAEFCIHPFVDAGVLSNGDVTLCCLDYDGKLAVGNMKGNTIEAILNGKPAMDLRAAMFGRHPLPLFCQQCQAKATLSSTSKQKVKKEKLKN